MKTVCLLHDFQCLLLSEAMNKASENIFGGVQALIYHPPYKTCQYAWLLCSKDDPLSLNDMIHFVELHSGVIDSWAHGKLLCSALQFITWYELFVGSFEGVVKERDGVEGKETKRHGTTVFEVDAKMLPYSQALGTCQGDPPVKRLKYTSVAECAILFRLPGLPHAYMLRYLHCMGVPDGLNVRPGIANAVSNVPVHSVSETSYWNILRKFPESDGVTRQTLHGFDEGPCEKDLQTYSFGVGCVC